MNKILKFVRMRTLHSRQGFLRIAIFAALHVRCRRCPSRERHHLAERNSRIPRARRRRSAHRILGRRRWPTRQLRCEAQIVSRPLALHLAYRPFQRATVLLAVARLGRWPSSISGVGCSAHRCPQSKEQPLRRCSRLLPGQPIQCRAIAAHPGLQPVRQG